jgi:hypothetical protein
MIAELAWHLRIPTLDASIIIGRARARLEQCGLHERMADRVLKRVVADALRSRRPIDLLELEVRTIVEREASKATKSLFGDSNLERSVRQRQNYVRKQRRAERCETTDMRK